MIKPSYGSEGYFYLVLVEKKGGAGEGERYNVRG